MFKELFSLIFAGLITMGGWVGLPVHDGGFNNEKDTDKIEEIEVSSSTISSTTPRTDRTKDETRGESNKSSSKNGVVGNSKISEKGVRVIDDNDSDDGDEDENENESEQGDDSNKGGIKTSPIKSPVTSSATSSPTTSILPITSSYTLSQVSAHKNATSCWTAVNGSVYDVTLFIKQHPGGSGAILSLCGIDGSSAFNGQHGGQARPASELAGFKIGVLVK